MGPQLRSIFSQKKKRRKGTHDLDGVSQSVAFAVDKVDTFSSSPHQLDGLGGIDGRGNAVRGRKLIQRDNAEREVLRNEWNCARGNREERGENSESVEDHVGQWGVEQGSFERMIRAEDVYDDVVLDSVDDRVGSHLLLIVFPAGVLMFKS